MPNAPHIASSRPASAISEEPLAVALSRLLDRRGLTVSGLGSLLRAEGVAISRTRLHQLCTGTGAAPTAEQMERLASVLGVHPGHFAEYRLWRARALLDPAVVGFDRAMANFARMRGRRGLTWVDDEPGAGRYPGPVSSPSKERA
ncbi:helix-turn-helix domain-containing protein [Miltoncostaea marina]|uniref:helix-turn-helix domain-containing protein n=1 Tax=Miltoncostaea marina TaxID=2843215 RepID=UPI001C3E374F|nr:helix-turn-helix transcriptional regulator [Miltoncostaea marina]